jgi:hypothetical protein
MEGVNAIATLVELRARQPDLSTDDHIGGLEVM